VIAHSPQFAVPARKLRAPSAFPLAQPAPVAAAFTDRVDVVHTVTFYMALSFVFIKFCFLQEVLAWVLHVNTYILYIFALPAIVGMLLTGGLRRTMAARPAYYWVAFGLWTAIATPFSSWIGGSIGITRGFFEYNLIMLFVVAGLVVTWRQCRILVASIGLAALINVMTAKLFASEAGGRFELAFGSVSNANDFAAHLLLTIPFLLLFFSNSKSVVLRVAAFLAFGFGMITIFRTGSRGAMLALGIDILFILWKGTSRQRIALACLVPIVAIAIPVFVSGGVLNRLQSFSTTQADADEGAVESSNFRRYELQKAVEYTFRFPLFGVGPGQFSNYEGGHTKFFGTHGAFHEVHNTFLQAFAESGFPGGILLLMSWGSTFLLLHRVYRDAKKRPDCRDIQSTAFYIMLGTAGFCTAIFFLNFLYYYYGPVLAGMAISISRAAKYEFEHRKPVAAVAQDFRKPLAAAAQAY